MTNFYKVAQSGMNDKTFGNPTFFYKSLEEFISEFPLSEHQCVFQINRELNKIGYFIFGDSDCTTRFKIYLE